MRDAYLPKGPLPPVEDFTGALIPEDSERLTSSRTLNLEDYSQTIIATEPAQDLLRYWDGLYAQPFTGLTSDGTVQPELFKVADEGFEPEAAVAAAEALLAGLSGDERTQAAHSVDAPEWRGWYNPEWLVNRYGLRLDGTSELTQEHVLALMRTCFSQAGVDKITQARVANQYLGELYDLRHIMNAWSYHLLLFGTPSTTEPWGWSIYGHHLALNVVVLGGQIVISPTFLGTEPTVITRPDGADFRLLSQEAELGLELMQSLTPDLRQQATIYEQLEDPAMPEGRWWFADERHLGGAFQDNRIVPYEGVQGDVLTREQRALIVRICETFVSYLPDGPRAARLRQIERELDNTWWSWIGGHGETDPFYYRIQSPVVMVEFDNHCGIWLTNTEPARYHVHTIVRTPNAGDYGRDLLRQHREAAVAQNSEYESVR